MAVERGRSIHRGWPATATALALGVAAAGQVAAEPDDLQPFHWGYAAAFGSGTYRLGDATETRAVRVALAKTLRDTPSVEQGGMGVRLLLPVAVGVQGLDEAELPPERPADRVEKASFLPGVELELPTAERWMLRARAQLGWGKELEGAGRSARLGAVGIRARFAADALGRPAWISGLLWAGIDREAQDRRSLLRLTQGVEFEVGAPSWRFRDAPLSLRPHLLGDWYHRPPPALARGDGGFAKVDREWQLGVAVVRDGGFKLLGFGFDGVGLAWRFSDHSEGIRIYLDSVF